MKKNISVFNFKKLQYVDVAIFVEHKDREIEICSHIAKHLLKNHKLSTIILSENFYSYLLFLLKPSVVVLPYVVRFKVMPIYAAYKLYGDNAIYVSLNWEQYLTPNNEIVREPNNKFLKNGVYHIAWFQNYADLLSKWAVPSSKIWIVGNPNMEQLKRKIYIKRQKRFELAKHLNIDLEKKWIFLPMNYVWSFVSENYIRSRVNNGYSLRIAREFQSYTKRCFDAFLNFLIELSALEDAVIILRPHPSINNEDYLNGLKNKGVILPKNIILNKEYSVSDWTICSDLVGSSWSTAVWDAYNIGKPCFLYTPFKRPDWLNVWWNDIVPNIDKVNDISFSPNTSVPNESNVTLSIANNIAIMRNKTITSTKTKDINYKCIRNPFILRNLIKNIGRLFIHILNSKSKLLYKIRHDYFKPIVFSNIKE